MTDAARVRGGGGPEYNNVNWGTVAQRMLMNEPLEGLDEAAVRIVQDHKPDSWKYMHRNVRRAYHVIFNYQSKATSGYAEDLPESKL